MLSTIWSLRTARMLALSAKSIGSLILYPARKRSLSLKHQPLARQDFLISSPEPWCPASRPRAPPETKTWRRRSAGRSKSLGRDSASVDLGTSRGARDLQPYWVVPTGKPRGQSPRGLCKTFLAERVFRSSCCVRSPIRSMIRAAAMAVF